MINIELLLLIFASLLLVSVVASKASSRTGIPALLLFLLIGMLAGPQGPGGLGFAGPALAQAIGVVALALILFSGGMDTAWSQVRPVLWSGMALANIGVVVSATVMATIAVLLLGFTLLEGLLLGAIVSSTDAAAVFSVMRARSVNLRGNLEPLIELESGSNDPIAVFLTAGITGLLVGAGGGLIALAPEFALQMVIGTLVGLLMGRVMITAVNQVRLGQEGLYPVLTLALSLLTYGLAAVLGGNGFLAIYIAGMTMGNHNFIHKRSLMRFHDGMAWLMQIAMFITLGLVVQPAALLPVIGDGLLMSLCLIFVARPISVFVALSFSKLTAGEKLMVSWVGLRGAVPIVLATFPLLAGVPRAETIFNLVFFIVLTSVLLQGTTIPLVARLLGLQTDKYVEYHYPQEFIPQLSATSQLIELIISAHSAANGRSILSLGLPRGSLVVSITRDGAAVVPDGGTVLQTGDRVLVLAEREVLPIIRERILTPQVDQVQPA